MTFMIAATIALTIAMIAPEPYKLETGKFTYQTEVATLKDAGRDKEIPIRVCFPKELGNFPLIVLSHGFRGSRDGLQPLARHWVSHGYVCILPTHSDSIQLMPPGEKLKAFDTGPGSFSDWRSRPLDDRYIIAHIAEVETAIPAVKRKIDESRIGIGGHSFGAQTTMLLAGLRPRIGGDGLEEPKAKAFVMLSPQGPGGLMNEKAYLGIKRPSLFVTGSEDNPPIKTPVPQTPESRELPFKLASPGDKFLLFIEGGKHNFGGINEQQFPGAGSRDEDQVNWVRMAGLAMWDGYVKGEKAAVDWLKSGALKEVSKGKVRWESR